MRRGEIWWATLPDPSGSGPGCRRPLLVVQADSFNKSRIQTVLAAAITSNVRLAEAPGNVLLSPRESKVTRNSVANVSQVITLDRRFFTEKVGKLPPRTMAQISVGLRLALSL